MLWQLESFFVVSLKSDSICADFYELQLWVDLCFPVQWFWPQPALETLLYQPHILLHTIGLWLRSLDPYSFDERGVCERWCHDSIDPDQSVSIVNSSFLCWTVNHCAHDVLALLTWKYIDANIIIQQSGSALCFFSYIYTH